VRHAPDNAVILAKYKPANCRYRLNSKARIHGSGLGYLRRSRIWKRSRRQQKWNANPGPGFSERIIDRYPPRRRRMNGRGRNSGGIVVMRFGSNALNVDLGCQEEARRNLWIATPGMEIVSVTIAPAHDASITPSSAT